ncbi:Golgi membrane protein 1 [Solea solea]|uniref:Golgi membrane protein 1 n=1 Tax=Solea solea TaxID=90069 RepID=UPI00272BBB65|nr:Golgi membrane protein 1 [Solea solea]XP_058491879.1 Golgi membrane protein 1 [Solea solea]
MGGLGNGRRGVRSPPLLIGALIACILVLGFNYWVSSSRNLELQTKLYELEGQVRRGATERGAAELKKIEFQEEIQRQREQISHVESLYRTQLEAAQDSCNKEKIKHQRNISSCAKTTQEIKGQLNQLNEDLGNQQKELQSCQGNIKTLNNKLTYDMTHCHSQVLSQKELCDERVAAAKLEVQKKMEKLMLPPAASSHENPSTAATHQQGAVVTVAHTVKTATVVNHTLGLSQPKGKELLTNEIIVDRAADVSEDLPLVNDVAKMESQSDPSAAAAVVVVKEASLPPPEGAVKTQVADTEPSKLEKNNLTEDKEMKVMDVHEEDTPTEEADPGMEGMLIGQGNVDETPVDQKLEEPEEYDADEQIVGGDLEKQQQQNKPAENIDKEMEEELADYNGNDDNEGEFEADKQAELAQN